MNKRKVCFLISLAAASVVTATIVKRNKKIYASQVIQKGNNASPSDKKKSKEQIAEIIVEEFNPLIIEVEIENDNQEDILELSEEELLDSDFEIITNEELETSDLSHIKVKRNAEEKAVKRTLGTVIAGLIVTSLVGVSNTSAEIVESQSVPSIEVSSTKEMPSNTATSSVPEKEGSVETLTIPEVASEEVINKPELMLTLESTVVDEKAEVIEIPQGSIVGFLEESYVETDIGAEMLEEAAVNYEVDELIVEEDSEEKEFSNGVLTVNGSYSYDECYLLAQLIYNESNNQCEEGQIAVAEVVLNRINSASFPNSIYDVIYQPGQFSNNKAIRNRKPSEEQIYIAQSVLNGELRVFNNPDVLFFRNPRITSGISPESEVNWGKLPYYKNIGDHVFYLCKGSRLTEDIIEKNNASVIPSLPAINLGDVPVEEGLQPGEYYKVDVDTGELILIYDIEQDSTVETSTKASVCTKAKELANEVDCYYWGGKPNGIGLNNTRKELDCSGYISWVLMTALDTSISQNDMGTANFADAFGLKPIFASDLEAGDIGFSYEPGVTDPTNHCGIYLGNGYWIHCNSKNNGVTIEQTNLFNYFYSI